jgi:predicted CopG family antitoxin
MLTTITIDDQLLEELKQFTQTKSLQEVLTEALTVYIQRQKQIQLIQLFGTIDYDVSYDYKEQRRLQ